MEGGHGGSESSFPSHFPIRKRKNRFFRLAYPLPSVILLYSYFHTNTCNRIPCISLVTRSQYANPLLRIFTFLETPELAGLASERILSTDGGH